MQSRFQSFFWLSVLCFPRSEKPVPGGLSVTCALPRGLWQFFRVAHSVGVYSSPPPTGHGTLRKSGAVGFFGFLFCFF